MASSALSIAAGLLPRVPAYLSRDFTCVSIRSRSSVQASGDEYRSDRFHIKAGLSASFGGGAAANAAIGNAVVQSNATCRYLLIEYMTNPRCQVSGHITRPVQNRKHGVTRMEG